MELCNGFLAHGESEPFWRRTARINSVGGYVGEGALLFNHIRVLPTKVTVHNPGGVYSIAVAVFLAQCTENILRERTLLPDNLLSDRRVKEVHLTPQDALKFGLVHSITEFALPKGNEIIQI